MSLVRVRDRIGNPIPSVSVRLSTEDQDSAHAYDERFTDRAGQTAFPHPVPAARYTVHVNYTDDVCGIGLRNIYEAVSVSVADLETDVILVVLPRLGSGGGGGGDLTQRPRRGTSLYGSYGNTHWDTQTFAHMISDAGLNATDVWCFSGWGDGSRLPFIRRSDGKWDLYAWNEEAFDAAESRTRYDNSYGIRTRWTFLDYYTGFSDRGIRPELPHPATGPFRQQNNVNGIDYGGDHAFEIIGGSNDWVSAYVEKFVGRLKGLGADFQVGNEMAESSMHDRIIAIVKSVWPEAHVSASRNSDAPSEYMNMIGTHHHDAVNFHGWKDPARLDQVFPEDTNRPKTYRALLATAGVEPVRIIACSDGARNGNPDPRHAYDWGPLLEAFRFASDHGCNIDHQSAAKMALATYGTYDLSYVETGFLRQLAQL